MLSQLSKEFSESLDSFQVPFFGAYLHKLFSYIVQFSRYIVSPLSAAAWLIYHIIPPLSTLFFSFLKKFFTFFFLPYLVIGYFLTQHIWVFIRRSDNLPHSDAEKFLPEQRKYFPDSAAVFLSDPPAHSARHSLPTSLRRALSVPADTEDL